MPYMTETRGDVIRRFIWWKLRWETGRWIGFSVNHRGKVFAERVWESLTEEPGGEHEN